MFYQLKEQAPQATELVFNERNIHHGPAMDQALRHLHSAYVLFLDSDSEVMKGGFVEMMLTLLEENPRHYVVGPICMLIKRQIYLTLPPFVRHGAPCLENMISAEKNDIH